MGRSEGQRSRQTAASIKNVPVSRDCRVRREQRCWRRGEGGKGWALLAADDRTGLYRRPPPVHRGTGGEAGPVSSD